MSEIIRKYWAQWKPVTWDLLRCDSNDGRHIIGSSLTINDWILFDCTGNGVSFRNSQEDMTQIVSATLTALSHIVYC
jgi:hypothetical protein